MQIPCCTICKSPNVNELFSDHNRRDKLKCKGTYSLCLKCKHVFLSDRPAWNEIVHFYSCVIPDCTANLRTGEFCVQAPSPIKKMLQKLRFRPHSWPLSKANKSQNQLLDLGCGTGTKLIEFYKRGYQIWGVDVSPEAIKIAREILPQAKFLVSELENVNLPEDYFDFIRIDNALEHIDNPQLLVSRCFQLLRNNGRIMIYVPHGRSFSLRLLKGNSISSWIPFHLNLFSKNSLSYLLMEAGFTNIKVQGYYPATWLPVSIIQSGILTKYRNNKLFNILCYPAGWFFSKIGLAEELFALGIKKNE